MLGTGRGVEIGETAPENFLLMHPQRLAKMLVGEGQPAGDVGAPDMNWEVLDEGMVESPGILEGIGDLAPLEDLAVQHGVRIGQLPGAFVHPDLQLVVRLPQRFLNPLPLENLRLQGHVGRVDLCRPLRHAILQLEPRPMQTHLSPPPALHLKMDHQAGQPGGEESRDHRQLGLTMVRQQRHQDEKPENRGSPERAPE